EQLAARVGEREQLASVLLLGADQPLVLQLRERGVDRAGARAPRAAAALLDLLHDLVAVARLLREQQQRRRADVAPAGAPPARARTTHRAQSARSRSRIPVRSRDGGGICACVLPWKTY